MNSSPGFLSLGWISVLVGLLSLAMAIFGVVMTMRARRRVRMTSLSQDFALIGGSAVYPDEIEVLYQGVPVPKITASTIWIYNLGNTTVRGADIVPSDPLRFQFPGNVLNVSVSKATRDVIGFSACISAEPNTVHWTFEFLDPDDGAILKVLHDGDTETPKGAGTIIGLPNGLGHWPLGYRRYWRKAKSDAGEFVLIGISVGALLSIRFCAERNGSLRGRRFLRPSPPGRWCRRVVLDLECGSMRVRGRGLAALAGVVGILSFGPLTRLMCASPTISYHCPSCPSRSCAWHAR